MAMKDWFGSLFSKDRRRAERVDSPELIAYFFTGASPEKRHEVRDISSTGFYLVTEESLYPGTVVTVTLQRKDGGTETVERTVAVQSRAMRVGEDGVGLAFVAPDHVMPSNEPSHYRIGVDKKTLNGFLRRLLKKS